MNREKTFCPKQGETELTDEALEKVTGGVSDETYQQISAAADELLQMLGEGNDNINNIRPQIGTSENAGTGGAAVWQSTFKGTDSFRP